MAGPRALAVLFLLAFLFTDAFEFCKGELSNGIAFEQKKDTIISENEWRIVLDINVRELYDEIGTIENLYDIVESQFKNLTSNPSILWFRDIAFELVKIRSSLDLYKNDLTELLELLPNDRSKRGLINVGGSALKFLFGVATNDDLEETNARVTQLQEIATSVIHSKEDQLTLLKDVNKKIGLNSKAIVEVMNKLTTFSEKVSLEFSNLEAHWSDFFSSLYQYIHVSNEIRELGQVVDEAKLRIVEFRHGLELVKTNKLSSKLFPPSDLLKILTKVEKLIPVELRLVAPASVENVFLYYDICSVQAVSTWTSVRLLVNVPLTSSAHQFETYKIHVIPVYNSNLKAWISWKLSKDYLLISNDRQYYLPLTSVDLGTCKSNVFFWCSNFVNLRHRQVNDCYYKLFMGSNTVQNCSKIVSTNVVSPVFIKSGNDWIYSVDQPQKITLKCWISNKNQLYSNFVSKSIEIKKTNILTNVTNCDIFGPNFKIFSKLQGKIRFSRNISKLYIPVIDSMLSSKEHFALSSNLTLAFETLNKLSDSLENDKVDIKLDKLLKELEKGSNKITVDHSFFYLFLVFLAISVVLLVVVYCSRRNICSRRRPAQDGAQTNITIQSGSALQELVTSPATSAKD